MPTNPNPIAAAAAEEYARGVVYQWDYHDSFRNVPGDEQEPRNVMLARAYLELQKHFAPDEGKAFILGQSKLGAVVFVPDKQGGHIEFQGKVWRVEKT